MADLSAYADFSIQLNYKTGKLVFTDTSAYPGGVGAGITGSVTVIQPDGITRQGAFTDILYATSPSLQIELRRNTLNEPQEGTYVVTYTVKHKDYDYTTITKSRTLVYARPQGAIQTAFDVFTPILNFVDATNYSQSAFTVSSQTRAWNVQVGSVGQKTGSGSILNLQVGGNYYDATYEGDLTVTITYASTVYDDLTLVDEIYAFVSAQANTPPAYTTLKAYLKTIKQRFDELTSVRKTTAARQDYEYASDLLFHIKQRICDEDFTGLYDQIQELLNIYHNRVSAVYVNTNGVLAAYDYSDVDCGTGTPGGGSATATISFIVGQTVGAPEAGSSTWTHSSINSATRLIRNTTPTPTVEWNGNPYYSVSGSTITIYNDTFQEGDLLQI